MNETVVVSLTVLCDSTEETLKVCETVLRVATGLAWNDSKVSINLTKIEELEVESNIE